MLPLNSVTNQFQVLEILNTDGSQFCTLEPRNQVFMKYIQVYFYIFHSNIINFPYSASLSLFSLIELFSNLLDA